VLDSPVKDQREAFDRAVDRRVHVRSGDSDPYRSRRVEGNGHGAGDLVTPPAVLAGAKHDSCVAEFTGVTCQCREHAVFSVGPRLRAHGVVVGDDVNAVHSPNDSQAVSHPMRSICATASSLDWRIVRRGRFESKRSVQDERPYCFIFRQSVTVLILSASAAFRRLPRNLSSARSIITRSCSCRSSVSSPGR